jgi:mRNA interferase MazF
MKNSEIWIVDLNPTVGFEKNKVRPVVIISPDNINLPNKIIVPITSWKEKYSEVPWQVKILADTTNKLREDSSADTFQIRSISVERFRKRIGILDNISMHNIYQALKIVFDL